MIRPFDNHTPQISESAYIDETAVIIGDVEIGDNSSVWPGAVIRGDLGKITIGRECVAEDNCVIHSGAPGTAFEDVSIEDRVSGYKVFKKVLNRYYQVCTGFFGKAP